MPDERIAMLPMKVVILAGCSALIALTFWFGRLQGQTESSSEQQSAIQETETGLVPEVDVAVRAFLTIRFGTIEKPVFHKDLPIDFGAADPAKQHKLGWKWEAGQTAYLARCVACHGEAGDGDGAGPKAKSLPRRPRDFRLGLFQWTSTKPGRRASRHDLRETLRVGIPGSGMPGFKDITEAESTSLIEYVRWLTLRGETKRRLLSHLRFDYDLASQQRAIKRGLTAERFAADNTRFLKENFPSLTQYVADSTANSWGRSQLESSILRPTMKRDAPTAESIARGRALFTSSKTKCDSCHGATGKGDGSAMLRLQYVPGSQPLRLYEKAGLHDVWGQPVVMPDLTAGRFRGGASRTTLYRRIAIGIKGAGMPAMTATLETTELEDLVDYVVSLSDKPTGPSRHKPVRGAKLTDVRLVAVKSPTLGRPSLTKVQASLTNSGTLVGRVLFSGTPPMLPPLVPKGKAAKDANICAAKSDIPNESLLIDPKTRGVANVFVYLAAAPPGPRPAAILTKPLVFARKDCRFLPHAMIAYVGQPLTLANADPLVTNFHTFPVRNAPINVLVAPNGKPAKPLVYQRAEKVPLAVRCDIHSWMKAYHLPLDHPYGAITDSQGQFKIAGLPPGTYSFVIWHEDTGFLERAYRINITAKQTLSIALKYTAERFASVTKK
jgi:mono/diheme cytochrome c family protein